MNFIYLLKSQAPGVSSTDGNSTDTYFLLVVTTCAFPIMTSENVCCE